MTHANSLEPANSDINGLPIAGWLTYPSLFVGLVYNDNAYRSDIHRQSAWGTRIIPSFTADLNNGIHRTTVYGTADVQFYTIDQANTINANTGIVHVYEAQPDLIFRLGGNYVRQADPFSSGIVDARGTILSNFSRANILSESASVEKKFGQSFLVLGDTIASTQYDDEFDSNRNGTIYTLTGRAGYWITPSIYAYAEPSVDWRNYRASLLDSKGYRAVAGVGSNRIGLLAGEVYGGYQAENYDNAIGAVGGSVFGARLTYSPTRYWRLRATVDRTVGVSTQPTALTPEGTSLRVTHAVLESNYDLWREWALSARVGYDRGEYINSPRLDNAWVTGARLTYSVWRNVGVWADYQGNFLQSNVEAAGHWQNITTVGVWYRF